jgi:two-component system, LytTR family, response regulator
MKLTCIVLDDEEIAINHLIKYINKIPYLELVSTFTNPAEAINFLQKNNIDLIFLDIQMPNHELDGMDFLNLMGDKYNYIFTTAHPEYALKSYEYNTLDYLHKPFSFERFTNAVSKVYTRFIEKYTQKTKGIEVESYSEENDDLIRSKTGNYIFIKTDNRIQKVILSDILFVESLGNYVTVYTTKGKFITLLNMKEMQEALSSDKFIRVHRSFIISLEKIEFVEGNQIFLDKDSPIPLGETYRNQLWEALNSKIIARKG